VADRRCVNRVIVHALPPITTNEGTTPVLNVRFGSLADIAAPGRDVCFVPRKRTFRVVSSHLMLTPS
jgi:hypothetical protein